MQLPRSLKKKKKKNTGFLKSATLFIPTTTDIYTKLLTSSSESVVKVLTEAFFDNSIYISSNFQTTTFS